MRPDTTGSGSAASGPSGDSLGMPPEIAGGPESTALSRLNAVDVRPRLVCFPAEDLRDASNVATRDASRRDVQERRICGWCQASIRAAARRDSKYCGQRCRQAAHRFHVPSRRAGAAQPVSAGLPRRFAYADPPYPGLARRYYADQPDFAGEVDQVELINRLACSYDGWALSTSAAALPSLLPACPPGTKVAAWFRGERPTQSYSPLNAWEPVLYFGGRRYLSSGSARRVDALVHVARARLTDPNRIVGAKPAEFCAWLFQLLGATAEDEFIDLFPGSGGVAKAWETYRAAAPDASRGDRDETRLARQVVDVSRRDPVATLQERCG